MSVIGLRPLDRHDLAVALEEAALPRLRELLTQRGRGHCMRVTDIDDILATRLCARLRAEVPTAVVVILSNGRTALPEALTVSSTKLVELRNPLPDGTQRPPLLVFIPNDVRTAAEDSYSRATFEEISLGDIYETLRDQLIRGLPPAIRDAVSGIIRYLTDGDSPWPFADDESIVRFLLTARLNDNDPEAVGAALYELALVPDFELLIDPANSMARVRRNRECVQALTWSDKSERGRVLELGLSDANLRQRLGRFLVAAGLEDPRSWTRQVVADRANWDLAFNNWTFDDGGYVRDTICISNVNAHLQVLDAATTADGPIELAGQRVLPVGPGGVKKFSVSFQVDPVPSRLVGLGSFVLQIVSCESGSVSLVRNRSAWKGPKTSATVTFSRIDRIEWEEGWYFVRVLARSETGELFPLADANGEPVQPGEGDPGTAPNESDLFYVLPGTEVDVEPPQRALQREASMVHARTRLRFAALLASEARRDPAEVTLAAVRWAERSPRARAVGSEMLEFDFGRDGRINVPVSRVLRFLEQSILNNADGPLSWRVPISADGAGEPVAESSPWPSSDLAANFLAARRAYFTALLAGPKPAPGWAAESAAQDEQFVTQAADFYALRPLIIEYADAYRALIADLLRSAEADGPATASHGPLQSLRQLLAIDTIALSVRDHRGRRREAALVAPTHPLRALWLATWAHVSEDWLAAAKPAPREQVAPAREALLRTLTPIGFPSVLPLSTGRLLVAIGSLHPFWTLYAPTHEEDPRGLVGDVCAALGLPEPAANGSPVTGAALSARIQRYLVQHPYVRSLTLNVFNPGRATSIADMLVSLQASPELADLRFDVRLFAPDADAPGLGEALTELLAPTASTTSREVDAFATPTGSHLRPKLAIATLPSAEFRRAPEKYPAHISLLFDVFPAEEVGAAPPLAEPTTAPVHGLCQDFDVEYRDDETMVRWSRQPRHGLAQPVSGAEELTDLLSTLPELMSRAMASVATGEVGISLRPVITLALDSDHRSLLHQVHEVSDWVLTIDRNLGIEFFDHGGVADRPEYLIDYTPEVTGPGSGHRLIITSRSSAELEAMLKPVLEQYGLPTTSTNSLAVLNQLRALSGRLALKLVSAPNQRAEALGLALSRMYLEHQGVFANQVVVPLDAHLDLYRAIARSGDDIADDVSFRRTDLALFDLDYSTRTITCRLVEVKCYGHTGGIGGLAQLKRSIAEQIAQSQEVISHHFDPNRWSANDRPDRPIKTRELAALLEFYLDRAVRYRAMDPDAEREARALLRSLDMGYQLRFTRTALIFDFDRNGTEAAHVEDGIEYHRIGADLIRQLIAAAEPNAEEGGGIADGTRTASARSLARLAMRRDRAPFVPTLTKAAFIAPTRDRTVTEATFWRDEGRSIARTSVTADTALTTDTAVPADTIVVPDRATGKPPTPAKTREQPSGPLAAPVTLELLPQAGQPLAYDVMLGHTGDSPQYGILGEHLGRRVAIDLNQTHTISLFGVQGGGKSYTLGTVVEMASMPIENINRLPRPLATVIFHYSPTMDYAPEFTTMVAPNTDEAQVDLLRQRYGAQPQGLADVVLLVPRDKLTERREEFPGIEVRPLTFAAAELQASHWRFLMGAVGNQATYVRQVSRVMKSLRDRLTLDGLRQGIEATTMPDHLKTLALGRLDLAAEYIDDSFRISDLARPGRLIIVDLRDEFIEKDEALGLFVVLLQLFADAKYGGEDFNKLVVFDEAHKYIDSPDLVAGLVEVVREMRHKATSIMVASQDPPSVPIALIELSSQIIMHKFNSPAWLKHIQKANAALSELSPDKMAQLGTGEAYVWSSKATDDEFSHRATKIRCRPRVTQHGGATKTAVM